MVTNRLFRSVPKTNQCTVSLKVCENQNWEREKNAQSEQQQKSYDRYFCFLRSSPSLLAIFRRKSIRNTCAKHFSSLNAKKLHFSSSLFSYVSFGCTFLPVRKLKNTKRQKIRTNRHENGITKEKKTLSINSIVSKRAPNSRREKNQHIYIYAYGTHIHVYSGDMTVCRRHETVAEQRTIGNARTQWQWTIRTFYRQ